MITGTLIGDRELIAKFNELAPAMKLELDATVQKLGYALQLRVQRDYLRGPRPGRLGVKTGRLMGSITQGGQDSRSRFEATATTSYAYVGTNVPYGAMWENGFDKKVGAGARNGKFAGMSAAARDRYFSKHPPGVKSVEARPFLKPALDEMRPLIAEQIQIALQAQAAKVLK